MRLTRLADLLALKYQLTSIAADPMTLTPSPEVMAEVRGLLKTLREAWLDGPRVRDQSILAWAERPNEQPEFEIIRELVSLVKDLAVHPSYNATSIYEDVQRGLTLSKMLKDRGIGDIESILKRELAGRMTVSMKEDIEDRGRNIRTFLRRLDSAFDKVKKKLFKYVPAEKRKQIDEQSLGGYELQKPKAMRKSTLGNFPIEYALKAKPYGLDDIEFVTQLMHEQGLRPLVEHLMRSIKHGNKPTAPPAVLSQRDSFEQKRLKLLTNLRLLNEISEEEFREAANLGRKREEAEDWQALTPTQQWSKQMQEAKQQKLFEEEEQPHVLTKEQLGQQIEQRDLEHEKRLEQKQKEEEDLLSKYNGLTFEQWI